MGETNYLRYCTVIGLNRSDIDNEDSYILPQLIWYRGYIVCYYLCGHVFTMQTDMLQLCVFSVM